MRGDGTGFNQLHKGIAGGEGIFMSKMGNECPAVAFHMDDVVAEFDDKLPDFGLR